MGGGGVSGPRPFGRSCLLVESVHSVFWSARGRNGQEENPGPDQYRQLESLGIRLPADPSITARWPVPCRLPKAGFLLKSFLRISCRLRCLYGSFWWIIGWNKNAQHLVGRLPITDYVENFEQCYDYSTKFELLRLFDQKTFDQN